MNEGKAFPKIPEYVEPILRILREAGSEGFLVYGCVRDSLMGRIPNDWDICTAMEPERVLETFEGQGITVIPTGLKHGTVTVMSCSEGLKSPPSERTGYILMDVIQMRWLLQQRGYYSMCRSA